MKQISLKIFFILLAMLLTACSSTKAPVIDGWKQPASDVSDYRVQPEDTLESIAESYDMDCRQLARVNHLSEPYKLYVGQILHMSEAVPANAAYNAVPAGQAVVSTVPEPAAFTPNNTNSSEVSKTENVAHSSVVNAPAMKPAASKGKWLWPTKGSVERRFGVTGNQGLDIAGTYGQPIFAVASGKVMYAGSGMPGYGNLIIIKHSDSILSAYAFNKSLLVKEGDSVTAGQTIASMGKNDVKQIVLHFEIRRNGTPVDPTPYLR